MNARVLLLVLVSVAVQARHHARNDDSDTTNAKSVLQVLCSTQIDQAALQRVQTCINTIENDRLKKQATSLLERKDKFCQNGQLVLSLHGINGKLAERLHNHAEERADNENESRLEKIKEYIKEVAEFLKEVRDFEQCVIGRRT